MMALAFVHFVLLVLVLLRSQLSKIANEGAWMLKISLAVTFGLIFVYVLNDSFLYALQICGGYLVPVWYFLQVPAYIKVELDHRGSDLFN